MKRKPRLRLLRNIAPFAALTALFMSMTPAWSEEGMWTFDNFPSAKVAKTYGFAPDKAFLEKVQSASVRLAFGCSGSFISPSGLVMTNHHCAQECISHLSTAASNLNVDGFYAKQLEDEIKCPVMEVNQLISIGDVTARIRRATKTLKAQSANVARKAEIARITKECDRQVRCDVVTLYHGGEYKLYRYKPFRDVRLVFAPEFDIAFFGGDPDNFTFPRYDLDLALLRVYENGAPARTPDHFSWSERGVQPGELTFVSGNPGGTQRLNTVAELEFERDVAQPRSIRYISELRGVLSRYADESAEHRKQALDDLFGYENSLKAIVGRQATLVSPRFMSVKQSHERMLRARVAVDPAKERRFGKAWDNIAAAEKVANELALRYAFVEGGRPLGFQSDLLLHARTLVRGAVERPKPNDRRLPEFADARLPTVQVRLFGPAPIFAEYEKTKLAWSLAKLREYLGADDSFVRAVLGKRSPDEVAGEIAGSTLADPAVRRSLWSGGQAAIAASTDPAISLVRALDSRARVIRKEYEDRVEAPLRANDELVAEAQFAVLGTGTYPDATFTARLSYGSVKGYGVNGRQIAPITFVRGLYERATGRDPFKLPLSWVNAQSTLDPATPMNFVTTNDIIGGNSGSPVINKKAQIVGLIFDGNIESLGGDFGYDGTQNRAVAVHSVAIATALQTIYHADRILTEVGM